MTHYLAVFNKILFFIKAACCGLTLCQYFFLNSLSHHRSQVELLGYHIFKKPDRTSKHPMPWRVRGRKIRKRNLLPTQAGSLRERRTLLARSNFGAICTQQAALIKNRILLNTAK